MVVLLLWDGRHVDIGGWGDLKGCSEAGRGVAKLWWCCCCGCCCGRGVLGGDFHGQRCGVGRAAAVAVGGC